MVVRALLVDLEFASLGSMLVLSMGEPVFGHSSRSHRWNVRKRRRSIFA